MYMEKVITRLKEQGHDFSTFQSCTEREILMLEQEMETHLPAAYREFLLLMGHDGGEVLSGTDCFYPDLPQIQLSARALLRQNNVPTSLPSDAFIFLYHGYQFLFFRTSEGDNPPVYYYMEGDPSTHTFPQTFAHFTDFMLSIIEE